MTTQRRIEEAQVALLEEALRSAKVVNAEAEREARAKAEAAEAERDTKRHIHALVLTVKQVDDLPTPKGGWS